MTFFTDEQFRQLLHNGSPANRDRDHAPVVKLHIPGTNYQWLLCEIEPETPDRAFGLCDTGMGCPELGYVSLLELARVNIGDITVQRDDSFKADYPMSVYGEVARTCQAISDDPYALSQAYRVMFAFHNRKPG